MFTIDLQPSNTRSRILSQLVSLIMAMTYFLLIGCSSNPLDVNIDAIDVNTELIQVDPLLRTSDSVELRNNHDKLVEELGFLYTYELEMNLQSPIDSSVYTKINQFYSS